MVDPKKERPMRRAIVSVGLMCFIGPSFAESQSAVPAAPFYNDAKLNELRASPSSRSKSISTLCNLRQLTASVPSLSRKERTDCGSHGPLRFAKAAATRRRIARRLQMILRTEKTSIVETRRSTPRPCRHRVRGRRSRSNILAVSPRISRLRPSGRSDACRGSS